MISRMTLFVTVLAVLGLSAGAARAQGYFDFASIPGVGSSPTVEINLNPAMLGFVQQAVGASGDPETMNLLKGIEGVRVRVYEDLEDPRAVMDFIEDASGELERDGWQRAVYINDDDERVHIYVKFGDGSNVAGMTVMIADGDDEAVFINIAGVINPETLGAVSRAAGIDLDDLTDGALRVVPRSGRGDDD
jgi:hypothetical protein